MYTFEEYRRPSKEIHPNFGEVIVTPKDCFSVVEDPEEGTFVTIKWDDKNYLSYKVGANGILMARDRNTNKFTNMSVFKFAREGV